MMTCARSIKEQECGGDMIEVAGESGMVWGWICKKCNRPMEKCRACGGAFKSLAVHFEHSGKCLILAETATQRSMHAIAKKRPNP